MYPAHAATRGSGPSNKRDTIERPQTNAHSDRQIERQTAKYRDRGSIGCCCCYCCCCDNHHDGDNDDDEDNGSIAAEKVSQLSRSGKGKGKGNGNGQERKEQKTAPQGHTRRERRCSNRYGGLVSVKEAGHAHEPLLCRHLLRFKTERASRPEAALKDAIRLLFFFFFLLADRSRVAAGAANRSATS